MKDLLERLVNAKTSNEMLAMVEEYIKPLSWYKFLKLERFNIWDLMACYELTEDNETTIWKDGTPTKEKEEGTKVITKILDQIVVTDA